MQNLTKRQQSVLDRLTQWVEEGRKESLSQVAERMGLHYVSFKQHLSALVTKGAIALESRGRGKSPMIVLLKDTLGLPLLGEITAGGLADAEQVVEGYLQLPAQGRFALRVRGDSMAGYLLNGDVVMMEHRDWHEGDIVAAYVDGETTLKYISRHSDHFLLRPHNPEYTPIEVSLDELHIQGVYCGVVRGGLIPMLLREGSDNYVN